MACKSLFAYPRANMLRLPMQRYPSVPMSARTFTASPSEKCRTPQIPERSKSYAYPSTARKGMPGSRCNLAL